MTKITKPTRDGFGDEILALAPDVPEMVIIDGDIGKSMRTVPFQQQYPNQHVNVGIAEQCQAAVACGLATMGKVPVIATYAVFGSMRMIEVIRQSACYTNLNVKMACSHGGLTPANDGGSHQGIEDMGILRSIPGMTVIMGCDYNATRKLFNQMILDHKGPAYIRFTRDAVLGIYDEDVELTIGKANKIFDGGDVTIIANGDIMSVAVDAANVLCGKGIGVRLLDMHTIKPLDNEAVIAAINETKGIVTVEDHNIMNGLGSAVAEIVGENGGGIVKRVGIMDKFGESGPYEELLAQNGITTEEIVKKCEAIVRGE